MRLNFYIAMLCIGLASHSWAQDAEFPYNAIVLNDGAEVHSGPGDSHYATHQLKENQLVQVFRHDPGGWCAIRPPSKSFSLIPESAAKIVGQDESGRDVAEILANGTQAWVGTVLGPVEKPLWQVKLKKGEQVSIVGKATWPHPSGKSLVWLQVEPPAGEYRWVRMDDLQLPPAEDAATKVDYSEPPAIEKNRIQKRPRTKTKPIATKNPAFKSEAVAKSSSAGWKAATRPIPKAKEKRSQYSGTFKRTVSDRDREIARRDEGFVEQATFLNDEPSDPRFEAWDGNTIPGITDMPRSSNSPDRFASLNSMKKQTRSFVREQPEQMGMSARSTPALSTARRTNATSTALRDDSTLIEIEDELSAEMLKDPQSWNLTEIKFATERAKAVSSDPVERLALQHVLDKIARCDELRKGYQQASPFTNSAVSTPAVAAGVDRVYDATGLLKRLASSSGSIDPVYVLQDSLGNVTHEIAGSTGMNLGQYVNKYVGVIGRRGFNKRINLRHVTVDRVIVMR